jgi:phosphodiesterase/alkaline phosphatase D-like protein
MASRTASGRTRARLANYAGPFVRTRPHLADRHLAHAGAASSVVELGDQARACVQRRYTCFRHRHADGLAPDTEYFYRVQALTADARACRRSSGSGR